MDSKQKKIMIIGSSWEQIPLIKKAKEMGCHVLGTDPDKNAEGFNFVDQSEWLISELFEVPVHLMVLPQQTVSFH